MQTRQHSCSGVAATTHFEFVQVQGELHEKEAEVASQSSSFEVTRGFLASQVLISKMVLISKVLPSKLAGPAPPTHT